MGFLGALGGLFGGGGGGGDSARLGTKESQNISTNTQYSYDNKQNNALTTQSGIAARDSVVSVTNNTVDGGAVRDALAAAVAITSKGIEENSTGFNKAVDLVGKTSQGAFDLAGFVTKTAKDMAKDSIDAQNVITNSAMSATTATARDAIASNNAAMKDAFAVVDANGSRLAKNYSDMLGQTSHIADVGLQAAIDAAKNSQSLASNAVGEVKAAWKDAKAFESGKDGQLTQVVMLVMAGVVALFAVRSFAK